MLRLHVQQLHNCTRQALRSCSKESNYDESRALTMATRKWSLLMTSQLHDDFCWQRKQTKCDDTASDSDARAEARAKFDAVLPKPTTNATDDSIMLRSSQHPTNTKYNVRTIVHTYIISNNKIV